MIVVVGFMGAGKTTVGRLLAAKLGVGFTDSDAVITERAGRPIREIFASSGEAAFRDLEHRVIADLLAGPDAVLALGGGAVGHPGTRSLLSSGVATVVYLRVGYDDALARVGGDEGRPMLVGDVAALYQRRLAGYASVATLTVDTGGRAPEDIATEILGPAAPRPGLEPDDKGVVAAGRPRRRCRFGCCSLEWAAQRERPLVARRCLVISTAKGLDACLPCFAAECHLPVRGLPVP